MVQYDVTGHKDLRLERTEDLATGEEETLLRRLMWQVVNLLQPRATGSLGVHLPCSSLDSQGDVGGGQHAHPPRQPDQLAYQLSDLEATFISQDLSNCGIDISALCHSSFQDYKTCQGDKYHEGKNILVRMG
ncbi:hypothetical protein MC885_004578 [Smutsia gigantea]|nr:hypothetical protein MC885_004578 [Smutsia gigantea]